MYIKRRRPDSMEVQQMKTQAREERARKLVGVVQMIMFSKYTHHIKKESIEWIFHHICITKIEAPGPNASLSETK